MDLYDDLDTKQRAGQIDGWSSGIKLLQTQLALKKAIAPPVVKKEVPKRSTLLAPVMLLKAKRPTNEPDDMFKGSEAPSNKPISKIQTTYNAQPIMPANRAVNDYDWNVVDEYDPLWPNEYEKLKERREKDIERSRDRDRSRDDRKRRNTRYNDNESPSNKYSGFGGRSDDIDNYNNKSPPSAQVRTGGAAIAPPKSLQESTPIIPAFQTSNASVPYSSGSVAAKIMAKYGFKDGQGLGKQEQGMSMALQVEKTSKRGGRIIHEKEINQPSIPSPSAPPAPSQPQASKEEPSITEIMKAPSKVVLLRNMVGAGDVDNELEGEVKDECNTKYGEVGSVIINEVPNVAAEEAVRIFVEFKRIESAIKAVVDLNGRFFGGRQVKAGFFPFEKYKSYQLHD